jgi:DHA1 family purine base/nucleoside efflux pump-like MFS transporter
LSGGTVGVLLLVYGLGAVVGNVVGGWTTDRFGSLRTLLAALTGFVMVVSTLTLTATSIIGAGLALFVWSLVTWSFNPPIQNLLLELGSGGGLLLALNASAIYFGSGLAAVVGGLVISLVGVQFLPPIAAGLGIIVLGLLLTLRRDPALQRTEHLKQVEDSACAAALAD